MSKCWYCNNDLTTGDNPKHFGICNKCYDEMFKSGDVIIRSLTNKIAELKKQLKSQTAEIVEKIKEQIFNYFDVKNMEEYESLSLIDSVFTADAVIDMLDTILKKVWRRR